MKIKLVPSLKQIGQESHVEAITAIQFNAENEYYIYVSILEI